jgi:hypothetical protein
MPRPVRLRAAEELGYHPNLVVITGAGTYVMASFFRDGPADAGR